MSKEDFSKFFEEEDNKIKKQFGLESTLKQMLWDGQVSNIKFNKTFIDILRLMKCCVENPDYKKELYKIDLKDYITEEAEAEIALELPNKKELKVYTKKKDQFGLESMLEQKLLGGQVDEEEFNETFTGIVHLMKRCVENGDYKKMLYEIDLKNYRD